MRGVSTESSFENSDPRVLWLVTWRSNLEYRPVVPNNEEKKGKLSIRRIESRDGETDERDLGSKLASSTRLHVSFRS